MERVDGFKSRNISWNRKTDKPGISRREQTWIGNQAEEERQGRGTQCGPVTLTWAKLHNLGGYKSGYYRAMR